MKSKITAILLLAIATLLSCNNSKTTLPLVGTWELVSATSTEKDSTFSTFDASHKMIKIINATHFAFLNHSLKDTSAATFSAGGGSYTLNDSIYTETLEYFADKKWENNKFQFVVKIQNDTLTQKGIEKVEKLGIEHIIIEKYRRVKSI